MIPRASQERSQGPRGAQGLIWIVAVALSVATAQAAPRGSGRLSPGLAIAPPADTAAGSSSVGRAEAQKADSVFEARAEEILRRSRTELDRAQGTIDAFLRIVGFGLAVLGVASGFLAFIGFREFASIRKLRKQARAARQQFVQLQPLRRAFETALAEIDEKFQKAPEPTGASVVRAGVAPPPEEAGQAFQDADNLIVLCDQLALVADHAVLPKHFVRLSTYWQLAGDYARAVTRARRATVLDDRSVEAWMELGRSLAYHAAEDLQEGSGQKAAALREAEEAVLTGVDLQGRHDAVSLHDLGWIHDERGDLAGAYRLYLPARAAAEAEGKPVGRIVYNLACNRAKAGEYPQAMESLEPVIDENRNWEAAAEDPDFAALRDDAEFGPRFQKLLEDSRKRNELSPEA